ncbi:MAG: hypothetical protein R2939_11310 [Kofleriaceae bacterium]
MRWMAGSFAALGLALTAPATADDAPVEEPAPRRPDATAAEIFAGPFPSSQLFAMPTARVVGAYQLHLSGDVSSLSEPGVLSTSGLAAIGFGDLAQLEYRHSAAVSAGSEQTFGLPAIGVQLEAPVRPWWWWPRLAVALRFGLPREARAAPGAPAVEERATDLYAVGGLELPGVDVHLGVRVSAARIDPVGGQGAEVARTLVLPTLGVRAATTRTTVMMAEVGKVPRFTLAATATEPGDIDDALFARVGVRWALTPFLAVDASVGYRIEVQRRAVDPATGGQLLDWDLRLGGELAVPWGALACRAAGVFCDDAARPARRQPQQEGARS